MGDYLTRISQFVVDTTFESLGPRVIDQARTVLCDTIGVIAAGAAQPEIPKLSRALRPYGRETSTLIGQKQKADPLQAALINGAAGTFLELDEGNQFARGHAAIHVVPAAFALGEEQGVSGKELLTALVLGYEIACRIGAACKLRMTMHPHGSWGTVGGAVAAGKLAKLSHEEMKRLINIASSLTVATSRKTMLEGGTVRNAYAGVSGQMAILSLYLLRSGFTGEADGLATVFGGVVSDTFVPEVMVEELGSRYEITRNYFKQYACCRYNHSTLDALYAIMARQKDGRLDPNNVETVRVETYSLAAQLSGKHPDNMLAAKFSIPFAVATTIVHGDSGVDCFLPDKLKERAVQDLASRVQVEERTEFTRMMPARRPSRVSVTLKDGETFSEMVLISKGDVEDPYSAEELEAKFLGLATPVYGDDEAQRILERAKRVDSFDDIRAFTEGL